MGKIEVVMERKREKGIQSEMDELIGLCEENKDETYKVKRLHKGNQR